MGGGSEELAIGFLRGVMAACEGLDVVCTAEREVVRRKAVAGSADEVVCAIAIGIDVGEVAPAGHVVSFGAGCSCDALIVDHLGALLLGVVPKIRSEFTFGICLRERSDGAGRTKKFLREER